MTENSAISAYFKKIGGVPLLTREEEQALFARMAKGDAKARDELIERNLKLVVPTAKQYMRCGVPFADLIQEGSMAIAKAVDKFDPALGNKFSTYATYWIKQRIGRYVKKHVKNVFVPEHVVNLAVQIAKAKRALAQEGVEEPTDRQISEALARDFGVAADAKTVRETVEFCRAETSLAAKVGEDGDTEFGDLLEDTASPDPSAAVDAEAASERISAAAAGLDRFEKSVVACRYGAGVPEKGLTPAQIAEMFSVSEEDVRRAAESSLRRSGVPESEIGRLLAA